MSQQEANRIVQAAQRMRRSRGVLRIALPTVAALGAGAAVATGAIPGGADGKTITGCYAGPDGAVVADHDEPIPGTLRVIDPSLRGGPNAVSDEYECQSGEKEITWSQTGPTGPVGPIGPQGPAGGQGSAGTPGSTGAPGSPLIGSTSFGLTNNAGETFLKIDSIAGESTDKQYKGDINIESFSLGAQASIGSASSGAGAGKATIQSFTITKALDKSSPQLLQDAVAGTRIPEAELFFAHRGKSSEQTYLKFDFSNLVVSSISDGQTSNGAPTEQVTFAFQKLEESFVGQGGKGSESVGWNVVANAKS
jgi:type VI secretion system secreted protein Hcp